MTDIKSLNDVLPEDLRGNLYRSVKDYFGIPLVFEHAKIVSDDDGEKAIFVVHEKTNAKQFYLSTRAGQPIQVANWMSENKPYPIIAQFMPKGRMTMLVDPNAAQDNGVED